MAMLSVEDAPTLIAVGASFPVGWHARGEFRRLNQNDYVYVGLRHNFRGS